ncbi:ABC transporter permease subunit [Paraferrimonas sedimenticola]|uniref:ABC high affinity phosphate uptake system permease PstC n=1 Tax=Paraferrimonas sedimenticola TaxID=375674 RepID=A0AA37RV67_9GAMM|nr:ABC transporter permease subunit [Paraferrimonas sedimenticola]GLP95212.1 ABC high affinity phosphate uptake system permease PstC [Paraferrimonas sedimenticola]
MNQLARQEDTPASAGILATQQGKRLIKDRLTQYGVTVGGIMVLLALVLIFFYLGYVVKPLFESAKIASGPQIQYASNVATIKLGVDEQNEVAFRASADGAIIYYGLTPNNQGVMANYQIEFPDGASPVSATRAMSHQQLAIWGLDNGQAFVAQPGFSVSYPNDKRLISPRLRFPYGEAPIQVDYQGLPLLGLAVGASEEKLTFAYVTPGEVRVSQQQAEVNFITEEVEWYAESGAITNAPSQVDRLLLTPDQRELILQSGSKIYIYDIRDVESVTLKQMLEAGEPQAKITDIELLAGASSILVANDNGVISQWFQVLGEGGRSYQRIREFNAGFAVSQLATEYYRKSFMAADSSGKTALFYTTSERQLLTFDTQMSLSGGMAFSPRSNSLLAQGENGAQLLMIDNPHPEVSWSALWQEVWYEGYPEPDYVWQSTSANEDFEAKFSLTPLAFGTLKAAMYAMLFAAPIAISGAIYTAYFMSPGVRAIVKPTVEIMEALPTVILGFLAGLWLAPLVEENLPGIVLMLILLPLSMLASAVAWHFMPQNWKLKLPEDYRELFLIPVLLAVGYGAFLLSPSLENLLFDGDTRAYITNDLGITFDQRNALVVGIAMGFAVIPTIFSIAEDAIFSVPRHLSNGSLALGATQWQTLTRVVILTASPGIFSAVMMGIGRAVGETMIVLMATGNTPIMEWSIFEGMRTLAANIAVEMPESAMGSSHYRVLFLAAFVLFIFTFIFNTLAEYVRQRLRDRYRAL